MRLKGGSRVIVAALAVGACQPSPPPRPTPTMAQVSPSMSAPSASAPAHAEPVERPKEVTLGRFTIDLPADVKLTKLDDPSDGTSTTGTFELTDHGVLVVSIRKRHPGAFCARILASDVDLFTRESVPGADHLEHIRVGEHDALLAVGRASRPVPNVSFAGHARLEVCKPQELLADVVLVLPERDVTPQDRERVLVMAASIRRRPVADVPSEQCIENEVPSACSTACEQGHADSCVKLGYLTYHGEGGLTQDRPAALRLFERACGAGSEKGCRALQILRSR